jgi:hypothetical protein
MQPEGLPILAEFVDLALKPKPELIIHAGNLPATAEALGDLLAAPGSFSTVAFLCASSDLRTAARHRRFPSAGTSSSLRRIGSASR